MGQFGSVPSQVAARARIASTAVALAGGGHVVTYGQLERRANRTAGRLLALGVETDRLVGLLTPRSPALAVGALAIMKTGAAYIPLDPAYPEHRLSVMLSEAKPDVVLAERDVAALVPPGPWTVVTVDRGGELDASAPDAPVDAVVDGAQRACVIFTSGSSGVPKGVEITHAGLANLVTWHRQAFAITPDDRATQIASPAFDAAGWELWPYLAAGASVHVPDNALRLDPAALRDWLVQTRITVTFAPTPLAERLMALPWPAAIALRTMLTGGDTLHRHASPSLPFTVVNNYGPTECTVVTTSGVVAVDAGQDELPSIGRPITGVEVQLLDEARRPVPPGEAGELYVGGVSLARGYLNRPDLTAERFVPHPCARGRRLYRTGDRARLRPDGTLAFLGRVDAQIKIRGHRIEPDEIVAVLDADPAVAASAVTARRDTGSEPRLVAYVVAATDATPTPGRLLEALRRRLPEFMVPSAFVRLDALPLTANGKLDASALPAPDRGNRLRDTTPAVPRDEVGARLAEILTGLLEVDHVDANDNFFLLGGHSLLGTQVIARVRETFGVNLSLRALFAAPTLAALAAEIARLLGAGG